MGVLRSLDSMFSVQQEELLKFYLGDPFIGNSLDQLRAL